MKFKIKTLSVLLSLILIVLCSINSAYAQKLDDVIEIEDFEDLYKSGDFYMGGQPSYDMLKWLKSENVSLVINLRTKDENKRFTKSSFNEKETLKDLGVVYKSIPISYPDSYNPENLKKFAEVLSKKDGKVFIHCASGGRVMSFMMAYLAQEKGYTLNEAMEFGKELGFMFHLENLLGKDIEMTIKE